MVLKPVYNWPVTVPFTKQFSEPLKEDMMLVVCGKIQTDAKNFVINLQQGTDSEIIPFHFGARFDEGTDKVLFSARKDKHWAPMSDTCCDFGKRGSDFKITFFTWTNCYQACVNGRHLLTYDHSPDCKIDTVNIYGDVKIDSLKVYDLRCT